MGICPVCRNRFSGGMFDFSTSRRLSANISGMVQEEVGCRCAKHSGGRPGNGICTLFEPCHIISARLIRNDSQRLEPACPPS
jgi:hypothetical protein